VVGSVVNLGLWSGRHDVWTGDYHFMFAWTFAIGIVIAVLMYVQMQQQAPDDGPTD